MSLRGPMQGCRLGREEDLSALCPSWACPRRCNYRAPHFLARACRLSGLGKVAFAFLWLLVFSIPWENALMVPSVGTIARLIGTLACGFGVLAIFEKQSIRLPGLGHVLMTLFVLWAAAS